MLVLSSFHEIFLLLPLYFYIQFDDQADTAQAQHSFFCDFQYCTVFDAKPCIIMLFRLFFKDVIVSHLMNNLAPQKKCPGGGGGAWYAKLDPRLICFNMGIVSLF